MADLITPRELRHVRCFSSMCLPAQIWLGERIDLKQAWNECPDGLWLLWFIDHGLSALNETYDTFFTSPNTHITMVIRFLEELPLAGGNTLAWYLEGTASYDVIAVLKTWQDGRHVEDKELLRRLNNEEAMGYLAPELLDFLKCLYKDRIDPEVDGLANLFFTAPVEITHVDDGTCARFTAALVREYVTWEQVEALLDRVIQSER